ncbi:putative Phospholipid-transporting ATPase protein [Naja naja]|nr:putative Phospholipid-transporting ATPase protein [Naja naja]
MYSSRVALSDECIALQPLSRATSQLSKISLLRQVQVSTAWSPCVASPMGNQPAHLLEECWSE